jgi:intraflagellar transport protein 80
MRFKIKKLEKNKHTDVVASVAWNAVNELVSASDDLTIFKWDINGEATSKLADLEVPAIDMDWLPTARAASELLAIGCANGAIKMMSKSGRIERTIDRAHNGSVTCVRWTFDGAALATAGEDGAIKVGEERRGNRLGLVEEPGAAIGADASREAGLLSSVESRQQ